MRHKLKLLVFLMIMALALLLAVMAFAADQAKKPKGAQQTAAIVTAKAPAALAGATADRAAKMYASQAAASLMEDIVEVAPGEMAEKMRMAANLSVDLLGKAVKAQTLYPSVKSLVLAGETYYDQRKMYSAASISETGALMGQSDLNIVACVDSPMKICQSPAVTCGQISQSPAEMCAFCPADKAPAACALSSA